MRRFGAAVMLAGALAVALALLAACSNRTANTEPGASERMPEPYTMTTVGAIKADMEFKYGESLEDNVHLRWAEDRLGIRIRYLWTVPEANFDTKLQLELDAGRPVPDVVALRSDSVHKLIDSGKFREVGSLFEQYASDTWKQAMSESGDIWEPYMRDGLKYAIPILDYAYSSDPVLWIRTDWLNKTGLAPPRTIEELEQVMRAFTTSDPDGNGEQDTYGLALALKSGVNTWMGDASWIFGAYGTIPKQWNEAPDGKLAYGSVDPGAGEALAAMQAWMAEGLLSGEAELMDENAAAESFVAGEAGIIAGPHWMVYWPLSGMTQGSNPAMFQAFPIPAGPEGKTGRRGSHIRNGAILISAAMEQPERFFDYQNYLFDYYALHEGEFKYGLAENYDWSNIDGQPSKDPTRIPGGAVRVASYTLTFDGARIPSLWREGGQPNTTEVLLSQADSSMIDRFQGAPTPTMNASQDLLRKLEEETYKQIIYGRLPASAFEDYVRRWQGLGGSRMTAEVNAWWQEAEGEQ